MKRKVSIIVPIYNEEKTIKKLLKQVENQKIPGWQKEIIVVDDGSTDSTPQILSNTDFPIKWLQHRKNKGKGAAIKTALRAVTGEAILIQDADLEYSPKDYKKLFDAYQSRKTQVVYGSRNLLVRKRGYFHYYWGGKFLTLLINLLYSAQLTDINTGFKLIDAKLLKSLSLTTQRFNFCEEVTIKLLQRKVTIVEVPITYQPRTFSEGKKLSIIDGLVGLWTIVRLTLNR